METNFVIAIDGPAASGKSTLARRLASVLGFLYVDSGALYRAVTWQVLGEGVDPAVPERVLDVLAHVVMDFYVDGGAVRFRINGADPGEELRGRAVNEAVSPVAAVAGVRRQVVAWLQSMRRFGGLVMEGRDIGTAVFPETPFKFYLDADPAERARRRHAEVVSKDVGVSVTEIGSSLSRRDTIDSGRKVHPLVVAPGAVRIDNTALSVDATIDFILQRLPADLALRAGGEFVRTRT